MGSVDWTEYLLLALFSLVIHFTLWKKDFFSLPRGGDPQLSIRLSDIILSFFIYFTFFYLLLFCSFHGIALFKLCNSRLLIAYLQLVMALLAITTWLILLSKRPHFDLKKLFKWGSSSLLEDLSFALLTYLISLPVIALINGLIEALNLYFFGYKGADQNAVLYLNSVRKDPLIFSLTLISIVIIAPLVEEVLFRGLLQRYLKKWLGHKAAILLSSLAFGLMHFQLSQGIGNIPLLTSLFVFALYLGFIYEKKKSLIASIMLHLIFNLVSVMRIVLV